MKRFHGLFGCTNRCGFFPNDELGYEYPEVYAKRFVGYKLPEYIVRDAEMAKNHKWYMSAMQICLNDLYSFDPEVVVNIMDFEDIIGINPIASSTCTGYPFQ